MRTTIEIRDDLRARLLALAARRGEKGYSRIIEEALEAFLRHERPRPVQPILDLRGTLSPEDGAAIREEIRRLRAGWRTE